MPAVSNCAQIFSYMLYYGYGTYRRDLFEKDRKYRNQRRSRREKLTEENKSVI